MRIKSILIQHSVINKAETHHIINAYDFAAVEKDIQTHLKKLVHDVSARFPESKACCAEILLRIKE